MLKRQSGSQAVLTDLLVKMGTEHPHHTVFQLLALKNGGRNRQGRVSASQTSATGPDRPTTRTWCWDMGLSSGFRKGNAAPAAHVKHDHGSHSGTGCRKRKAWLLLS